MSGSTRKFLKPFASKLLKPFFSWYLSKPRKDRYDGIEIDVPPGVFHPRFFLSTRLMLKHLERYDLAGQTLLELGAGSGLISVWTAKRGALVWASDINRTAVVTVNQNAAKNNVAVQAFESDLFSKIPPALFDYIVINPPYYAQTPTDASEHAWYCGEDFDYFKRLFEQMPAFRHPQSKVLMVLSEDCQIARITSLAAKASWDMEMIHADRKWGEWSFIFSLRYKKVA